MHDANLALVRVVRPGHGVKKTGGRTSYIRRSKNLALLESLSGLLLFCLHLFVKQKFVMFKLLFLVLTNRNSVLID